MYLRGFMEVIEVAKDCEAAPYLVYEDVNTVLCDLLEAYCSYRAVPVKFDHAIRRDFYHYLMILFEAEAEFNKKGLVQDWLAFLTITGLPYKPILVIRK